MIIIIPMSQESDPSIARPRIPNESSAVAFLQALREGRECWAVVGRTLTRPARDSAVVRLDNGFSNHGLDAQVSRRGFQSSSISPTHENAGSSPSFIVSADADIIQKSGELEKNDRCFQAPSIEVQDNETSQKVTRDEPDILTSSVETTSN
ncbi:uncharacterized protein CCOS01_16403 [Colletotrichum costaricense]|uniref:Uncharacterized protein n=1 Tax=Colletotrichum costaricense TaxID=1209916 RepID=A0AAI9YFG3_9PEZI|nr:uncharacterized protein CCOS01_16403 [Colletotrichum costaricense]KAK1506544.1 hypothetical protein CCOS01_16403 [Colletotrichum costaricense]